jgi:hypothetical protein
VHPNKVFQLAQGSSAKDFIASIELGRLHTESVTVQQGLKNELREGAQLNEIALGQIPQKGGITATEVGETKQSSSAVIRSVGKSVEENFLEPILNLAFMTGLQNFDFTEPRMIDALGSDTAKALAGIKVSYDKVGINFRVHAISSLIERGMKLRNLLGALAVFAQNQTFISLFFQEYSAPKVLGEILKLYGVDVLAFTLTEREKQIMAVQAAQAQAQAQAAANGGAPGAPAAIPGGFTPPQVRYTYTNNPPIGAGA